MNTLTVFLCASMVALSLIQPGQCYSCNMCRAFAGALIYVAENSATGLNNAYSAIIDRCVTNANRLEGADSADCSPFYNTYFTTLSSSYSNDITIDGLCAVINLCQQEAFLQLQDLIKSQNPSEINFGVPETGIVMQYGCNMCKSLAHSVSVTLDELAAIEDIEFSTAFHLCLVYWADENKPLWHQTCRCKTLIYDLFNEPLMHSGGSTERICESIGFCATTTQQDIPYRGFWRPPQDN